MKSNVKALFDLGNFKLPFVKDVLHSLVTKGLTMALGLLATILVTRTLGPELKGVYSLVLTWIMVIMQTSLFGLHASNSYHVAIDQKKLKVLLTNSIAFIGIVCSIIAFGLLVARFVFKIPLGLPDDQLLLIIIMGSYLSMSNIILQNLSIAIKEVNTNNYVLIGAKVISVAILVTLYFTDNLTVLNALLAYLVEMLCIVLVLWPFLSRKDKQRFRVDFKQFKESFRYGFKVYLSIILAFMVIRSDIFWVKYYLKFEDVGYYSTAVQLTDQISAIVALIAGILMPRLAMTRNLKDKKYKTKQVLIAISLLLFVLVVPAFILAPFIIELMYGAAFLPCVPSFRILLVAICFLSLQTILVQFLASEGFPRVIVFIWVGAFILNLILNVVLIPIWGIEGAGVASFISYLGVLIFVYFFIQKQYIKDGVESSTQNQVN